MIKDCIDLGPGPHFTDRSYLPPYVVNFILLSPMSSYFFSPLQNFTQEFGREAMSKFHILKLIEMYKLTEIENFGSWLLGYGI